MTKRRGPTQALRQRLPFRNCLLQRWQAHGTATYVGANTGSPRRRSRNPCSRTSRSKRQYGAIPCQVRLVVLATASSSSKYLRYCPTNDAIDVPAMYLEYTGRGCCIDVILQEFICKGVEDIMSSFAFQEINRNQDARDVFQVALLVLVRQIASPVPPQSCRFSVGPRRSRLTEKLGYISPYQLCMTRAEGEWLPTQISGCNNEERRAYLGK